MNTWKIQEKVFCFVLLTLTVHDSLNALVKWLKLGIVTPMRYNCVNFKWNHCVSKRQYYAHFLFEWCMLSFLMQWNMGVLLNANKEKPKSMIDYSTMPTNHDVRTFLHFCNVFLLFKIQVVAFVFLSFARKEIKTNILFSRQSLI